MESSYLAIGDSVVVRPGVTERGTGRDLAGWQGRIVELENGSEHMIVAWDSITLNQLLPADILRCEEWGSSWSGARLAAQDVLPAIARDEEEDVQVLRAAKQPREDHGELLDEPFVGAGG